MKLVALLAACAAAWPQTQPVPVKVTRLDSPEKTLRFEVVVPARPTDVWTALSTGEGLRTWLWKTARSTCGPAADGG
jgi:hypothetical protein